MESRLHIRNEPEFRLPFLHKSICIFTKDSVRLHWSAFSHFGADAPAARLLMILMMMMSAPRFVIHYAKECETFSNAL